jgi:hypothetical protein
LLAVISDRIHQGRQDLLHFSCYHFDLFRLVTQTFDVGLKLGDLVLNAILLGQQVIQIAELYLKRDFDQCQPMTEI